MSQCKQKDIATITNNVSLIFCTKLSVFEEFDTFEEQMDISNTKIMQSIGCVDLLKYQITYISKEEIAIFYIPLKTKYNNYKLSEMIKLLFDKYKKEIGDLKPKSTIEIKSLMYQKHHFFLPSIVFDENLIHNPCDYCLKYECIDCFCPDDEDIVHPNKQIQNLYEDYNNLILARQQKIKKQITDKMKEIRKQKKNNLSNKNGNK